jgi:addiction module HigA family antidote
MLRPSSDRQLADAIHVPYQRVNELINGKRGVIPSAALRLAKVFGTFSEFWLNFADAVGCHLCAAGEHSIRINDQWRICFEWDDGESCNVEIVDYHRG